MDSETIPVSTSQSRQQTLKRSSGRAISLLSVAELLYPFKRSATRKRKAWKVGRSREVEKGPGEPAFFLWLDVSSKSSFFVKKEKEPEIFSSSKAILFFVPRNLRAGAEGREGGREGGRVSFDRRGFTPVTETAEDIAKRAKKRGKNRARSTGRRIEIERGWLESKETHARSG